MFGWLQPVGILRQRGLRIGADIVRVVVEEDRLHVGVEILLLAHGVCWALRPPAANSPSRSPTHRPSPRRRAPPGDRWSTRSESLSSRPTEGTSPMPSIEIEVASVVRQVNCTWSPAEITVGVAVSCAVGAGAVAAAELSPRGGNGCFFLHPETATKATSKSEDVKSRDSRSFKGMLLLKKSSESSGRPGFLESSRVPPPDSQHP